MMRSSMDSISTSLPPRPAQKMVTHKTHGDKREDPYFWLRERENPEVLDYLNAENAYADEALKDTQVLQKELFEEMKARIKQDDSSVPIKDGEYFYYSKYEPGQDYPLVMRKKGSYTAADEMLLDGNALAKGLEYLSFGEVQHSPNHLLLGYSLDTVGRQIYTLHFKDLQSGRNLPHKIENVTGDFVWANDNRTLFYTQQEPETLRSYRVYRFDLPSGKSELIYEEKDETFSIGLSKSLTQKYIWIGTESKMTSEMLYLDADQPYGEFAVFCPRRHKHEYYVLDGGDRFYIMTNDKAVNFKLMETPYGKIGKSHWRDVIPHRKDVLLSSATVFRDHIVLQERKKGLTQIRIQDRKSKKMHVLSFKDPAYVAAVGSHAEFNSQHLRYYYQSMTTPYSVYDFNMKTHRQVVRKKDQVLGDFKAGSLVSERVWATGHDGTKIPISLVYKKGTKLDGRAPLLLYGYGSYGATVDPSFSRNRLSLLKRGWVFAIAHIRGGSDMGRAWYDNGKMLKKKNTFKDFISCAEFLLKKKYTHKEKLFAMGGSAGGLLMGAVANMRPDLFKGMVAQVPFVDVLTTMLDDSIPLTTAEYEEWGNPNEPKYYKYMKSYSPYDNVARKAYPHFLVTTGLHDPLVQYWEPAKWVARLRELKTDSHMVLFKIEMHAGHGGKSGRFEMLKEIALEYAFLLKMSVNNS